MDAALPAIVFAIVGAFAERAYAVWAALALAVGLAAVRLLRRQRATNAFYGLAAVLVAAGFSVVIGRTQGYFLPGVLTGGLTCLACFLSALIGRPLVAWTSYVARRWPLDWYWHPRVRPAYSEVTVAWGFYYALRVALQYAVYTKANVAVSAFVSILSGWPATIALLVASYLYGSWRLANLAGPSVAEYNRRAHPPWTSQRRGF